VKRLTKYFFEGLLFLVPVAVTVYVFYMAFVKIDNFINLPVPGAGFLVTIAIVTIIGFLASNILTRRLLGLLDKVFNRLPLIKLLYSSIKDLVGAFVGDKKSFDKPVLVTLSGDGCVKSAGFVTRESMEEWGLADQVAVYLPQSYNFAGNLILVPKDRVTPLDAESGKVMTFIVSGGVSGKG